MNHSCCLDSGFRSFVPEQHDTRSVLSIAQVVLAALPDEYRTLLRLHDQEQRSYVEIAGLLGISKDMVAVKLGRARRLMSSRLEEVIGKNTLQNSTTVVRRVQSQSL